MEKLLVKGTWYTVTTGSTCEVVDAKGRPLGTAEAGKQLTFKASTERITFSDDAAEVQAENFKGAPVKRWLLGLGRGVDALPKGYLAAEFVHRTEHQLLWTGLTANSETAIEMDCCTPRFDGSTWLFSNADIDKTETNKKFMLGRHSGGKASWYEFGKSSGTTSFTEPNNGREIVKMRKGFLQIGSQSQTISAAAFVGTTELSIFGNVRDTAVREMTVYGCKLHQDGELVRDFVPCIDNAGRTGMYDKAKRKMYHSADGEFTVGMTCEQARKLGKLPAGGGTLKVSLPSNYLEDDGVVNAIAEANARGWNIEVASTWDASGAAATFALRRIWVRKTQDEQGNYVAADGTRWAVESCVAMYNVDGSEPDAHGFDPFRSVDAAVAYWELEPVVYDEEKLLTEE